MCLISKFQYITILVTISNIHLIDVSSHGDPPKGCLNEPPAWRWLRAGHLGRWAPHRSTLDPGTLKLTVSHLKIDGWNTIVSFWGWHISLRGELLVFRECIPLSIYQVGLFVYSNSFCAWAHRFCRAIWEEDDISHVSLKGRITGVSEYLPFFKS